jgi:predicted kinase
VKPKVFFVIGPAGSGKSTVGKRIAKRYDAAYIDKDTVATGFTELLLELNGSDKNDRDHNAFYQSTILPVEYETILRICGDNLALGRSVVLDAPFGRFFKDPDYLLNARQKFAWADAELVVVHVTAEGRSVFDRVTKRGYGRDSWKIEHWQQFWAGAQQDSCEWAGAAHILLDNSGLGIELDGFDEALAVLFADVTTTDD